MAREGEPGRTGGARSASASLSIRPAMAEDEQSIWQMLAPIIRDGEAYAVPRDMNRDQALAFWNGPGYEVFVAETSGQVVGTYFIRPNQLGGGRHVANCGYATLASATGRGVGRRMCEHSIRIARERGYRAIQFNFVVSTNKRAVKLWTALGFQIVGTLPGAFEHPSLGAVDVLVMYLQL